MAEGTRSQIALHMDDYRNRISEHDKQLSELSGVLRDIHVKLTSMEARMEQTFRNPPTNGVEEVNSGTRLPTTANNSTDSTQRLLRSIKLDVPRFNGTDPHGWIFKAERFFDYHEVEESQRLKIASFHMDGAALQWFQWLHRNDMVSTWKAFLKNLITRFGASEYRDVQGELSKLLHWAEFSYNTSWHSAIGKSPFEAVFGREPPVLPSYQLGTAITEAVDGDLQKRDRLLSELKENLRRSQNRMKQQADKHRRDVQFEIGDFVLVKLQPYRQTSLSVMPFSKLNRRYYGPFKIIEKIGLVAYRLDLPIDAKIHPVFHISLLKEFRGDVQGQCSQLPLQAVDKHPIVQPIAIVNTRLKKCGGTLEPQLLVQWEGMPLEDTSWIFLKEFSKVFPHFNLEDKVCFQEGGNVSNKKEEQLLQEKKKEAEVDDIAKEVRRKKKPSWLNDYV